MSRFSGAPHRPLCRILIVAAVILVLEASMSGPAAADSRLAPCPNSPNCVSSRALDGRAAIAPLRIEGSPVESFACLTRLAAAMKRARVITAEEGFVHLEFRTLLGFVDDVAFELDPGGKVIHMRSASRLGYWDLGVNRRRIERIRTAFEQSCR